MMDKVTICINEPPNKLDFIGLCGLIWTKP